MTGFYITELIDKQIKQELKRLFMPANYKFPKIKHGQIVIPKEVLKQLAQGDFDFYDKLIRKIPCVKS